MRTCVPVIAICAASVIVSPASVFADELPKLRLGAWEQVVVLDAPQFPGLPPALAQQLAKGIGEQRHRVCVTTEDQNKLSEGFLEGNEGQCQIKNIKREGTNSSWDAVCDSTDEKGDTRGAGSVSGKMHFVMTKPSEDAFTLIVDAEGGAKGLRGTLRTKMAGTYLGADCAQFEAKTADEIFDKAKRSGQALAENPFFNEQRSVKK
jgi:hypothetical protein